MKERLIAVVVAGVLLVAVTLPILFTAPIIPSERAGIRQRGLDQVARSGAEIKCQSGTACGG
jgi:hypothetical protein